MADEPKTGLERFISDDQMTINLPVPLGTELFRVTTSCGNFCTFQREKFDTVFPPTESGRCGTDKPCHTVPWGIYKCTLRFQNLKSILTDFGDKVFVTENEAKTRMMKIVQKNQKTMRDLGFRVREDGNGI